MDDGKLTPEEFDQACNETPRAAYEQWMEQLDGCLESLDLLNPLCEEKFGDYAPNFGGLRKTVEELKQTVRILLGKKAAPAPEPEPEAASSSWSSSSWASEPEQPAESQEAAAAAPARAPARPKGPLAPEPVDRDDAIERVVAVTSWYRQNDYYSPVPYMLLRGIRWGELRAGGTEVDASLLEAPPTEIRQNLKRFASEADWAQVLETAETAAGMPCGRGWLDVQRYAVRACQETGYEAAATAIRAGLRGLLADYPQLPDLTLLDDTPTANAETKAWLAEFVNPPAAAPEESFIPALPSPRKRNRATGRARRYSMPSIWRWKPCARGARRTQSTCLHGKPCRNPRDAAGSAAGFSWPRSASARGTQPSLTRSSNSSSRRLSAAAWRTGRRGT